MKAAYLLEPGEIEIKEVEKPEPGDNEVLVEVKAVGMCGSDMEYYNHGRIGDFVVEEPLILGHEVAGKVVGTGDEVDEFTPGDRVTVEPGIPCRKCEHCKSGNYNLCPDVEFMATPPIDGAFAEYITNPQDFTFHLSDNISYEQGAMVEPLSVGLNAVEKANIKIGDKVLILGAGTIGLVTLQAALNAGATDITITDVIDKRLDKAEELGAGRAINVKEAEIPERGEYDVVIESAGVPATIKQAAKMAKGSGNLVLVGMAEESDLEFAIADILTKELNVRGIFRYANLYPRAINLIEADKVDLTSMITTKYSFEEIAEAFEEIDENQSDIIKAMIKW